MLTEAQVHAHVQLLARRALVMTVGGVTGGMGGGDGGVTGGGGAGGATCVALTAITSAGHRA